MKGVENNVNINKTTILADTKFDWLCVLRDQFTEMEILERRVHEINELIGIYYRGELGEADGFSYKELLKSKKTIQKLLAKKDDCTSSIMEEVCNLSSPLNTIVVDYLTDPELSISELAEYHGLTWEETNNILRKCERRLSRKIRVSDGELELLRQRLRVG